MKAAMTLCERELVRFFRQPNRVIGAVGQPVIFWLLFSAGFSASIDGYAQFFLPGIAALIVLFTAIFSTISIIEDRREGFLQGVLVAPVSRGSIVLGKLMGGTILATLQATVFLLLAPLVGVSLSPLLLLQAIGVLGLIGFALTGLGFVIAWRMDSTQGYHAIMSVFLFPMWLLSGSFFPAEGAGPVLAWILRLNPLTYGVKALRQSLGMETFDAMPLFFTAGFAAAMFVLSMRMASRPAKGDLR